MTKQNAYDGGIVAYLMTLSIADIDQILTTFGLAVGVAVGVTRLLLNYREWRGKRK